MSHRLRSISIPVGMLGLTLPPISSMEETHSEDGCGRVEVEWSKGGPVTC